MNSECDEVWMVGDGRRMSGRYYYLIVVRIVIKNNNDRCTSVIMRDRV